MERYTIKDAERAFERLATVLDKGTEQWVKDPERESGSRAVIGAWALDYNPIYGGCVITEICNVNGGITHPMGDSRRTPREFCAMVRFAIDAIKVGA